MADGAVFENEVIGRERHTGRLDIVGSGNRVEFEADVRSAMNITILGDGNRVTIGLGSYSAGHLHIEAHGARFELGEYASINDASFHMHEAGLIRIGARCAIAQHVWVTISDMHPIYDMATGERINPAADVIVEDDAWVGFRAVLLKGAHIGRGAVVGACSTVGGEVGPNCLAMGSPARVIREGVAWSWDFQTDTDPAKSGMAATAV